MSKRTASWLAWSMCALSLALIALSFLLIVLILNLNTPTYFYWLEPTAIAVGYSVIGAILVPRLPHHPIGWICCAIGILGAVEHFSGEYAVYALLAQPGPVAGGQAALWLSLWPWILMIGLIVFLILLFPTGRLPSRRWRWFAWLSAAVTLTATILAAISPDAVLYTLGPSDTGFISLPNPLGVEGLPNLYRPVQALVLTLIFVSAASLFVRRLRASGVERQQLKWFTYASTLAISGPILTYTISEALGALWLKWAGYALMGVGLVGVPISMGIAILR